MMENFVIDGKVTLPANIPDSQNFEELIQKICLEHGAEPTIAFVLQAEKDLDTADLANFVDQFCPNLDPTVDYRLEWLVDGLTALLKMGFKLVIVGSQDPQHNRFISAYWLTPNDLRVGWFGSTFVEYPTKQKWPTNNSIELFCPAIMTFAEKSRYAIMMDHILTEKVVLFENISVIKSRMPILMATDNSEVVLAEKHYENYRDEEIRHSFRHDLDGYKRLMDFCTKRAVKTTEHVS